MIKSIKHVVRLCKIAFILYCNGALFILHELKIALPLYGLLKILPFQKGEGSQGERLAHALEKLGPAFIKLGQTLATRPDIVGEDIATALTKLQDQIPTSRKFDYAQVIHEGLGRSVDELFSHFDSNAIAAASIAEVFKATTKDGHQVAVKILKPNVEQQFNQDIELFYWLAHLIEKKLPRSKRLKLVEVVKTLARSVEIEMDLRMEAAAASELKDNFIDDPTVHIPNIFWQLTSKQILTTQWIDGIALHDVKKLRESGFDPKMLCKNFAVLFFNQAYRDGFFHADMHPGNILVNQQGQIVFIDFGIMGRMDHKTRVYIAEILHGFLKRDYLKVAKLHFDAGYVPAHQSLYEFAQACRSIGEPIVGLPAHQISVAKLLAHLFEITKKFEMETQPQLLMIQKTTMLVEGVGAMLDPNVNMWQLAEPWIENWAGKNIGFDAKILEICKDVLAYLKARIKNLDQSN